jgi:hypothetical protein
MRFFLMDEKMTRPTRQRSERKPPKEDDPEQSQRFIELGKELGADKDAKALERGLKRLTEARPKRP